MAQSWVIGVILAVLASLCAALGDNLVKYSFRYWNEQEANGIEPPKMYKRPYWVLGIINMTVLNTSLNLASFAFADASLLISLGGLHIILNLPLAYYMNKEVSSRRAVGCNVLIMLGVMIVLITGNHESQFFTTSELKANFLNPLFIVCTIILVASGIFCYGMIRSGKPSRQKIGLTMVAGLVGSATQVFAKSMSLCLKDGAWINLFTWFCVLLTIISALSQVFLLNLCLDKFRANFVVPIVNSVMIVGGSTYASVFFKEMQRWDVTSTIFVPFGVFVTAFGVALLAREPEHLEADQAEEMASGSLERIAEEPDFVRLEDTVSTEAQQQALLEVL